MDFKAIKDFSGKNLLGKDIIIPYGTDIVMKQGFLYFQGVPFCTKTSEVARRFFIWNGDEKWEERLAYENIIYLEPRIKTWEVEVPIYDEAGNVIGKEKEICSGRYSPTEIIYIKKHFPDFLEPVEGIIYSDKFFIGSDISRVKKLFEYLSK